MAGVYTPAMINYVIGDATNPQGPGNKIVAHVCNDAGGFGKGFAAAVAKKWPEAQKGYYSWYSNQRWNGVLFERGQVQFVTAACGNLWEPDFTIVANMVAQEGYRKRYDDPSLRYIDYFSLGLCLEKVAGAAIAREASVHAPRFGTGLAGGSWDVIEPMINQYLCDRGVSVTIYDLA